MDAKRHRRAVERAELLRLHAPAEPIPGRRGAGRLTAVLAAHGPDVPLTRSDAERAMRELCEDVDLPRPSINRIVEGLEVDFSWHGHRLIVEVDGYAFHATRTAFEVDRRREVHLAARGWQVLRVSASQLRDEPAEVATAVRAALSAGRDRAAG